MAFPVWNIAWAEHWPPFTLRTQVKVAHPVIVLKNHQTGFSEIAPISTKGGLASVAIQLFGDNSWPHEQPTGKSFPEVLIKSGFQTKEFDAPLQYVCYLTLESGAHGDNVAKCENIGGKLKVFNISGEMAYSKLTSPWYPLSPEDRAALYCQIPSNWKPRAEPA